MTSLGPLLRRTQRQLENVGIGDAPIEADLIWMTALEIDRAELYARLSDVPSSSEAETAASLLDRRLRHEPAAYIMGKREFYGLELIVAPGVLVPRSDTETLVEEALRIVDNRGLAAPHIADVGCGSGAISIALAVHLPKATLHAIDISPRAIEITEDNAARHRVQERVHPALGDLLVPLTRAVDLITANLPYVMSWEIPTLEPEIRMFEPREALDGGDDGLDIVRRLLTQAPEYLAPGGIMLLEVDPRQIASISAFAAVSLPGTTVRTVRDLAGRERVVVIETSE
jgi:release factor glutamine methyltransferase